MNAVPFSKANAGNYKKSLVISMFAAFKKHGMLSHSPCTFDALQGRDEMQHVTAGKETTCFRSPD